MLWCGRRSDAAFLGPNRPAPFYHHFFRVCPKKDNSNISNSHGRRGFPHRSPSPTRPPPLPTPRGPPPPPRRQAPPLESRLPSTTDLIAEDGVGILLDTSSCRGRRRGRHGHAVLHACLKAHRTRCPHRKKLAAAKSVVLFAPSPSSPDLPIEAVIKFFNVPDVVVAAH
jgi:hypothetical protein